MKYIVIAVIVYCLYKIVKIIINNIEKRYFFISCDSKVFKQKMLAILEKAAFDVSEIPNEFDLNIQSQEEFLKIMKIIALADVVEDLYQDGVISVAGKYIWEEKDDNKRTIHRNNDSL